MIIPGIRDALDPATQFLALSTLDAVKSSTLHGHKPNGDWSSIIGIVTAICGNVLISVALNTQRYAHIRLHKQWVEKQRKRKVLLRQALYRAYGTALNGEIDVLQNGGDKSTKRTRRVTTTANETGESETAPLLSSSVSHTLDDIPDAGSEEIPQEIPKKSYLKSPLWWAGQVMMTVGEAGNFLAYGFAPASIVSPLGVVALVSNCIIAPFFLKEDFRKRDFFGVVIAIAGAITIAFSANDNNPKLGPDDIWGLIATWEFETYLGITVFAIICLMFASNKYGHKSIFIDLGLVGLFGIYHPLCLSRRLTPIRWIHCFVHKGCRFDAFIYPVQGSHVSCNILACRHPDPNCRDADQISQPRLKQI